MKAEEQAEFSEFVAGRWTWLYQAALLLTGDRGHAEDLAQATLVRVFGSWSRVRRAENMNAYTMQILINQNKNRFRKLRVEEHLTSAVPDRSDVDSTARSDQRSALMAALAGLPKRQRAVVLLRYWEGYSEAETAAILGCSAGTVKSQASKALAKLRTDAQVLSSL